MLETQHGFLACVICFCPAAAARMSCAFHQPSNSGAALAQAFRQVDDGRIASPRDYSAAIASGGRPAAVSTGAGLVVGCLTRNHAA
jgi:hypothetical protein